MLAVIIASGCRPPVPQQVIVPEAHPQPVVPVVGSVTIGPWGWTPVRERRPYLVTQRALITTRQDTLTRIDTVTSELATAFTQFVQANRISGSLTSFRVATGTRGAATPAGVTVPITIAANAVPSGYGATPQWSITTPVEGSPCSSAAWTVVQGVRDLWFRAPDTLRLGTIWRDSTSYTICRDGIPLHLHVERSFRVHEVTEREGRAVRSEEHTSELQSH